MSTKVITQDLMDLASEIERRDLTKGGTINQNLTLSSSTAIQGNAVFNASATFNGLVSIQNQLLIGVSAVANTWIMVSSVDVAGANNADNVINFTGLSSSYTYRLEFVCYSTIQYHAAVEFNSDQAANYYFSVLTANTGNSNGSNTASKTCWLDSDFTGYRLDANASLTGTATFRAKPGTNTKTLMTWNTVSDKWAGTDAAATTPSIHQGGCTYTGSSSLSSIQIMGSDASGTAIPDKKMSLIGHFELWRGPSWPLRVGQ